MNRRLRNIVTGLMAACALSLAQPIGGMVSWAASAKISFSDPNTSVGQEFNVTVKVTATDGNLGASDLVLSYDESYIKFVSGNNANGGAGSVRLIGTMDSSTTTEFAFNLKFKAVQAGDTSISVASQEIYDTDTQAVNVTKVGSSTVRVKAPATYSSEASLASLKVSPGQLTPAFSPDVLNYTVNVGVDVDKLAVSADVKDSKAKTKITGGSGLKTGANTVVCKVTAEDGQTVKSYTITVNKSETAEVTEPADGEAVVTGGAVAGEMKANYNDVEYSIATSFDPAALPEGYTQSTCTYSGTEIMSGSGYGLNLIYLQDGGGNGSFFIYMPETGALSPYVKKETAAKSILVLPVDDTIEIPEGFVQTPIELPDATVMGWVWETDTEKEYCVLYGMNENGEKGLYRFDIKEQTFQRYFQDPALKSRYDDAEVENLMNEYNALCKDYDLRFIVIVVLILICLILFFIVINLLMKRQEYRDRSDREEAPTPVRRRAIQEEEARLRQSQATRTDRGDDERTQQRRRPVQDDYRTPDRRGGVETPDLARRGPSSGNRQTTSGQRTASHQELRDRSRPEVMQQGTRGGYQDAAVRRMAGTLEPGYPEPARLNTSRPLQGYNGGRQPVQERQQNRPASGYADGRYPSKGNLQQGRSPQGRMPQVQPPQGHPSQNRPARERTDGRMPEQGYQEPGMNRNNRPAQAGFNGRKQEPGYPAQRYNSQGRPGDRYPEPDRTGRGRSGLLYDAPAQMNAGGRPVKNPRPDLRNQDTGMEEAIRQRELERAERARRSRERLERERLEDERRARGARPEERGNRKKRPGGDDFNFIDLN